MPLGLQATITLDPQTILDGNWGHDMAHALVRAKLQLERQVGRFS